MDDQSDFRCGCLCGRDEEIHDGNFDTGVVMVAYLVMLFIYDWRLYIAFHVFLRPHISLREKLKRQYHAAPRPERKAQGVLNEATLDRVENVLTYRVYGQDENRNADYEICPAGL